ncbi:dynamin family protein [Macrococcoides canis]|uniref:dynamin family protein n=1 Tax=Macrococcoides canis TaxID=1855823 RepID=UPI001AEBD639|nr:dynamin family protein [Macrococcus canis]QTQ08594.1 dynamin family protein [Macrococcus canis]
MNKREQLLEKLQSIKDSYGDNPIFSDEIEHLSMSLKKLESNIAVVGQFSVGKSSLLNALLGEDLLSSRTIESTKVLTRIRYCKDKASAKLLLTYKSGNIEERRMEDIEDLQGFTTFQGEQITDELEYVDLFWPVHFLNKDLVLIDTPGANSTTTSAFETTRKQLKNSAAIIYLFLATKGLDKIDYEILNELSEKGKKIFLVGNHRDKISDQDWLDVKADVEEKLKVLSNLQDVTVLSVAATNALKGKIHNDEEVIEKSHINELESVLYTYMNKQEYREAEYRSFEYELLMLEEEITNYENELQEKEIAIKNDRELRLNRLITLTNREFMEVQDFGIKILDERNTDLSEKEKYYKGLIEIEGSKTAAKFKKYLSNIQLDLKQFMISTPSDEEIRRYYYKFKNEVKEIYIELKENVEKIANDFIYLTNMNVNKQDEEFIKILKAVDTNTPIDWEEFSFIISHFSIEKAVYNIDDEDFSIYEDNYSYILEDEKLLKNKVKELEKTLEKNGGRLAEEIIELKKEETFCLKKIGSKPDPEPVYRESGFLIFKSSKLSGYDYSEVEKWERALQNTRERYKQEIRFIQEEYDEECRDIKEQINLINQKLEKIEDKKDEEVSFLIEKLYELVTNHYHQLKSTHEEKMKIIHAEWNNMVKYQNEVIDGHNNRIKTNFEQFIQQSAEKNISKIKVH